MARTNTKTRHVARLKPHIHQIQPLLEMEGQWKFNECSLGGDEWRPEISKPGLTRALQSGALRKVERVMPENDGTSRWVYEWDEDAKAELEAYLEDLDTLPCGHRVHIPDTRDDPDGVISCKHCGREYIESFFMALVEDSL